MKVVLEFDGFDTQQFERAFDSMDDNFSIADSIFWELDYGEGESVHHTEYGDITIKQQV